MPVQDKALTQVWYVLLAALVCWALVASLAFVRQAPRAQAAPAAKEATTEGARTGISFSRDVQPIFSATCALCHQGAGPADLTLEPGASYANLVGRPSSESNLPRVAPGNLQGSYLVHKLQGTQASVGGSGAQMPYSGTPLAPPQLALITGWIQEGAPNN